MAFWGPGVEWHERDVVVPAFRRWLEAQGWETETETGFVDLVAHRGNETIYAEVKGRRDQDRLRGNRILEPRARSSDRRVAGQSRRVESPANSRRRRLKRESRSDA